MWHMNNMTDCSSSTHSGQKEVHKWTNRIWNRAISLIYWWWWEGLVDMYRSCGQHCREQLWKTDLEYGGRKSFQNRVTVRQSVWRFVPTDSTVCGTRKGDVLHGSRVKEDQYNETNMMHFPFNLLRIKGPYMFRALLAAPQEVLHKRHLVCCVRIMSDGSATTAVKLQFQCSKHVEALDSQEIEWKVHHVGFIILIYYDAGQQNIK
jgi:hypothetical protein